MCEDKIRVPHYKETQYAEADTPLDIHSCPPIGPHHHQEAQRVGGPAHRFLECSFL